MEREVCSACERPMKARDYYATRGSEWGRLSLRVAKRGYGDAFMQLLPGTVHPSCRQHSKKIAQLITRSFDYDDFVQIEAHDDLVSTSQNILYRK